MLSALWSSPTPLSVREVLGRLKRRPSLAYTTVLTVLDRLYDKQLVDREMQGKAFLYRPRISREAWLGEQAARTLAAENGSPRSALLMAFLDSAERADPALVDHLSVLIEMRRKRKPKGDPEPGKGR